MTEYWVSKKQYWCKYCSIFIRDDAPSKKHHETGLKHIGNRERYIRDLYKTGNKAKLDRAEEAAELAKIEAAALKSGDTATKLTLLESLRAKQAALRAGGHKARDSGPKDKFANYTSAADLGFRDEETQKTEYEIEQELKGRAGDVGAWETVDYEPTGAYTGEGADTEDRGEGPSSGSRYDELYGAGEKRKLGQYDIKDEDDHEDFDFIRRQEDATVAAASSSSTTAQSSSAAPPPKRKPRLDPYDEDDWDPRAAIKGKVKSAPGSRPVEKHVQATNLDRESWTGKLDFKAEGGSGMVYKPGGGWVKAEGAEDGVEGQVEAAGDAEVNDEDRKPDISHDVKLDPDADSAPAIQEAKQDAASPAVEPVAVKAEPEIAAGGMFKKRRPPPSSRKK